MSRRSLGRVLLLFMFYLIPMNLYSVVDWADSSIITSSNSVHNEDLTLGNGAGSDVTITISQDVYIDARRDTTLTVSAVSRNVTLESRVGTYGHLIFHADETSKINVYCDYDLAFKAKYDNSSPNDMIVTFSGQGTTTFYLSDYNPDAAGAATRGAIVSFEGSALGGYAYPGESSQAIARYNPCRAYILMDQTESQAINEGRNKVVFKRRPGGSSSGTIYSDNVVGIHIDDCSMMTYLATDDNSYGALAFDPTHLGKGVMFLDIDQKNNSDAGHGGFNDGSLVIYGHSCPDYTESGIRTGVVLDSVRGKKALFRIIDDSRYTGGYGYGSGNSSPDTDTVRGLMVINRNTTVPKFAADPYQEDLLIGLSGTSGTNHPRQSSDGYWASKYSWKMADRITFDNTPTVTYNVQTGFILGKNGRIEVAHRTFLDYVATQTNLKIDPYLAQDYSTLEKGDASTYLDTAPYFKKKNPTALFVDGLYSSWYPTYAGTEDAEIYLYGDSKVLLRAGSKVTEDGTADGFPRTVAVENGDYIFTFTIDSGTYNGQYVPGSNITSGEGVSVLDLEAPLIVKGWGRSGYANADANYVSKTNYSTDDSSDLAELNLPTVSIDYLGREYNFVSDSLISRPLTKSSIYKLYDSPNILLNGNLELHGVLYNHNDITKLLNPSPSLALPNIVGGERKYFNDTVNPNASPSTSLEDNYKYPRLEFYNSTLDMHEHFVCSGLKLLVNEELNNLYSTIGFNNTSTFKFRDHGNDLDTRDHAYGRLFMATCSNNKMSDGSTNSTLEDTKLNIFRRYDKATPAQTIKLSFQSEAEHAGVQDHRSHHLVMLNRGVGASANMSIGWITTNGDDQAFPWEPLTGISGNYFDINTTTTAPESLTKTPPATVSIDGNYIYFGGIDSSGTKPTVPVVNSTEGSVLYVNHGGRITVTQPDATTDGYDVFFDIPVAYRLWNYNGLRGIVDLPKDQVEYGYGFGRQPYNLDMVTSGAVIDSVGVHLDTYNNSRVQGYSGRILQDRYSGEEYILDWRNRTDDNLPLKDSFKTVPTRYTAIISNAITMPVGVPYFGAGDGWADIVTQLKVAGATIADPMHLLIDGYASGRGYAWVKEIVSIESNPSVYGEGDHGIIFLRNGGRVGLGNNSWNSHSLNSWKLLGKDFLTISPAGNGTIDLNSDVFVVDRGAFIAEDSFGVAGVERLTINLNGNDLYVPAGGELDLSSFGQGGFHQEIEFAGEGRVVLGAGSIIRFPSSLGVIDANETNNAPVLYFNDNTRLVIEDDPEVGKSKYSTLDEVDVDKVKIFGKGQIWLNKDARFEVMGGAKVRVGSDDDTPDTDLVLSIQRQGDFLIGDEHEQGGSFEVGNPSHVTTAAVNFELVLNGAKARAHLDRGAFLGFGVGMIDNSNNIMNGSSTLATNPYVNSTTGEVYFSPDTTNAWKVQSLYNVNTIKITNTKGIFDHSNIFDGSNRLASMIAIGPVYADGDIAGSYTFDLADNLKSRILGGGNIMLLDEEVTTWINAWEYADGVMRETEQSPAEDYGMYNMISSSPITLQWRDSEFANSTISSSSSGGIKFVSGGSNPELDFFKFISYRPYKELRKKLINCGATEYDTYVGYVNTPQESTNYAAASANQIYRRANINVEGEGVAEDGLEKGVLGATGTDDISKIIIAGRK